MSDLKFTEEDGLFDISIENGEFVLDDTTESYIYQQLFSDARASDNFPKEHNRGFIGNLEYEVPIGSELWTIDNRRTSNNLALINDYCEKCLQDLINQNIVDTINVVSEYITNGVRITIKFTQGQQNRKMEVFKYDN